MAIVVKTSDPAALLKVIREAVDEGHVVTWSYDLDGDFTHTPSQWKHKAFFTPSIPSYPRDEINFLVTTSDGKGITPEIYAIYHGRFIEMLLAHFDEQFQMASATAQPV
jgi:hypothetical protein